METGALSYSRCVCENCGNNYATMLNDEIEMKKEACPNCKENKLKISGPLSFSEINSLFYGGG